MNEILKKAFALRKNQNFQEAIEVYQPIWQQDQNIFDDWAGWSFAFSLSKLNRHREALDVCRTLYPRFKSSEILNSLYAKCIYYTQFAANGKAISVDVLKKAAEAMMKMSPPHNEYSFTSRAIFKLIKAMMNQQTIDWQSIELWLLRMDPDLLDDRPFKMTDAKGKNIELASPKEEWYSNMVRVKGGLNMPQELLEVLEVARRQNFKWHYNNDIWFARKEAFALKEMGNRKKAEIILRNIVAQKKDWFLLYDLADILEQEEEALKLMARAALASGKDEHKVKLFQSLFELLKKTGKYINETDLHICLIAAIREGNGWPIKNELIGQIQNKELNYSDLGSSSIIKEKLIPFWKQISQLKTERASGVIGVIFPNNKAGFILLKDQKYYFTTGALEGRIQKGSKVSFEVEDSFDKKKNRVTKIAVRIQILK